MIYIAGFIVGLVTVYYSTLICIGIYQGIKIINYDNKKRGDFNTSP